MQPEKKEKAAKPDKGAGTGKAKKKVSIGMDL